MITELAALADQPRATFLDRYWHHRLASDLGQTLTEYWSEVLARDLSGSPRAVDRLTNIDVHGWLRLKPLTLRLYRPIPRPAGRSPPHPASANSPAPSGMDAGPAPAMMIGRSSLDSQRRGIHVLIEATSKQRRPWGTYTRW
jgi:hypothetical protein